MNVEPHSEYLQRHFRSGVDVTLRFPFGGQEVMLAMCLQRHGEDYGLFEINCTDPWEACLRETGMYFRDFTTPKGFFDNISQRSDIVTRITPIPGPSDTGMFWSPEFGR